MSYNATRLTVVHSVDNGRLTIPAAFHVHWPFPLQTHPTLWIEMIKRMHYLTLLGSVAAIGIGAMWLYRAVGL